MKKFHLLAIACLALICLSLLSACSTPKLDTPVDLEINTDTLELTWDEVDDARYYTVRIEGEKTKTSKTSRNSYSLTGLDAGIYTISVMANGKEGEIKDSDWSKSKTFEREKETGMAFVLINNNTEYELASRGSAKSSDGVFEIPSEYRGRKVTSIGTKAFFNQSDVKKIVIPDTVTSIGKQAFSNCSYLRLF